MPGAVIRPWKWLNGPTRELLGREISQARDSGAFVGVDSQQYVLGAPDIPEVSVETLNESRLAANWSTLDPREHEFTKRIGNECVAQRRSSTLSVPRSFWANGTTF